MVRLPFPKPYGPMEWYRADVALQMSTCLLPPHWIFQESIMSSLSSVEPALLGVLSESTKSPLPTHLRG